MLYSSWQIVAAVGSVLLTLGLIRFFINWRKADAIDILMFFFAGLLLFIAAVNSGTLDFVCTGGTFCVNGLQTYQGEVYFLYLFFPAALISWCLFIAACIIQLGTVFSRRSRGYSPE